MKTEKMLVAIKLPLVAIKLLVVAVLLSVFANSVAAQNDAWKFGIGLTRTDSAEVISYIARESPVLDVGLKVGDEIMRIDGHHLPPKALLNNALSGSQDSATLVVHRVAARDTVAVTIWKERMPKREARAGMLNQDTAYLSLAGLNIDNVEALERTLDSLAKGSDGFGDNNDQRVDRQMEAAAAILRDRSYVVLVNGFVHTLTPQERQDLMDSYIQAKYGWQMRTLILSLDESTGRVSPQVMRVIRLICEQHNITLIRLV